MQTIGAATTRDQVIWLVFNSRLSSPMVFSEVRLHRFFGLEFILYVPAQLLIEILAQDDDWFVRRYEP